MQRFTTIRAVLGLSALLVVLSLGTVGAQADTGFHGIAFNKGCDSPTLIGQPYSCSYQILNLVDQLHDTLKVNGLTDQVHSAGGDVNSGQLLSSLQLVFSDPSVTCTGGSGAGTSGSPYVGATSCLIPFNQNITTKPFSFYTAQANDFNLPGHSLTDTASLAWNDTCNVSDTTPLPRNCTTGAQSASAGSASEIDKLPSVTSTTIHNAAHGPVTVVEAGSTVHDFVTLTGTAGQPAPSGNLNIDFFTGTAANPCSGQPVNSGPVGPLVDQGGGVSTLDATGFTQGPLAPGLYGFIAHYPGDATYLASDGPCEPLRVVDANIQLTPSTATNEVNTNHTLHCHINVNDGTGSTNAPDGTICTVSIISGPGTPATQNCTIGNPTPGSGSCDVVITSGVVGTSVIRASTNVTVAGLVLHRETGDAHIGDGPDAQKVWVNANIQITPATATNAVGTNHVLTITVNALGGTIDAGPHTATATIVSGPGTFVGSPSCTYTGGAATASCTVTITSAAVGTTVVSATSNIPVNGVTITRTTNTAVNTAAGGSGNASKVWVNANIQIAPANATNAVNTNHVLTITVNALNGTIDAGPHTATASIASGPGTFVGPNTCTYTGGGASASCTVTITSAATGTTVVSATSDIPVNGQTITRTTGTAVNTAAGGSDNANKVWVNANIQITPANATNAVNTNHVLTITVNALNGLIDPGPHTATASIVSGPGSFVGGNTCTYTGGGATASCTVTITSAATGTTVVSATSDIPVNGQTITRTTNTAVNTAAGGSGNANKVWVNANIQITPATATNPVGTNHVLTITVNALNGTIDPGPHTATASIVSGPGSFVGGNTCTYTGGAATASCTVTITSSTPGTTVVQATSDIPVNGQTITRTTGTAVNTAAGGSDNAQKLWLQPDANIQLTPGTAANAVGTNHTLHCHVNVSVDSVTYTNAPDGTVCTVTITSGPGTPVSQNCTTSGGTGTCDVTITSSTTGTSTLNASTTVTVNGVVLTRTTTGTAGNSGPATKVWVDAFIQITPQNATNPTGTNHVLTITVTATNGGILASGTATATILPSSTTGNFVGSPSCNYTGGGTTASCTVTITSAVAGSTDVQASSAISFTNAVGSVTRTTGTAQNVTSGCQSNCGNANKQWVKAKITIAPDATNEINHNHTFTATVFTDNGSGYQHVGAGVDCEISLTGSNGATPNPAGPLVTVTDANGQCSITFTSATPGLVTGHGQSTLSVGGQSITVQTDGTGDNSANARKWFVDATILITPHDASNPIGTTHTLTVTATVNNGTGAGYVPVPNGTTINLTLSNAGGATATFTSGPGSGTAATSCTTTGGSCTATISSPTTGTTTVSASMTIAAGPTGAGFPAQATLTRSTNGAGVNGPATKEWGDDTVVTHVLDAANNDITGTTVTAGTVVHDTATVARTAGTPASLPNPTGTVTFTLYDNGTCNGNVLQTDPNEALSGGTATSVTFTTPSGTSAAFSYLAHYNGDANYPAHDAACEPFNTQGTPKGQIAPTQTTCSDYTSGTSQTLSAVNYSVSGGKIGQGINPGVFFFYSTITTTVPNQVVTITQSNNSTNNAALFGILNGQAWLWTADCASHIVGTTTGANGSGASFTVATPGTYVISLKYQTKSIAGTTAPIPADITYTFTTSLGGQTGASVLLHKQ